MAVRKTPNGRKWCCDLQLKDQPRFYDTFETESEARLRELEIKSCMKKGVQPPSSAPDSFLKKVPLLSVVVARVKRDRWSHQSSSLHHSLSIDQFAAWIGADIKVTRITTTKIADYVDYLRSSRKQADSTINKRLSSIRVVLEFCKASGYISVLPHMPHFKVPEGRKRWLDYEEEEQIFAEIPKRKQRLFFQLLLETGCRFGEMHSLQWDDIRDGVLWIWGIKAKGKKTRSIRLTVRALEVLVAIKQEDELEGDSMRYYSLQQAQKSKIFKVLPQEGMSMRQLGKVFKTAKNSAGYTDDLELTPHCLRHSCTTRLVNAGVHARTIQAWLGHKDIKTTLLYMHDDPAQQLKAVGRLDAQRADAIA